MTTKIETESKFQVDPQGFETVLRHGRVMKVIEQINVYFDNDWRLAASKSTFRVRVMSGAPPIVTLKLSLKQQGHERTAREVESPYHEAFPSRSPLQSLGRSINVSQDLSDAYCRELKCMDLNSLSRVGWMRNRRYVVEFSGVGSLEADCVHLPGGRKFFEIEIEAEEHEQRFQLVSVVRELVPSCIPSQVSKFERFRRALLPAH